MNLEGIDHVAIAVPDMKKAIAWYREVLGLERQHTEEWDGVPAFVGKGATAIAFFPQDNGPPRSRQGCWRTPEVPVIESNLPI